jgi:DNA polymerase III subunit delta'
LIDNLVTGFASLIDQKKTIQILTAILQKRTIPHALLFTGIDGAGKRSAAMAFAMALNCADRGQKSKHQSDVSSPTSALKKDQTSVIDPCGVCKSCRNIASNNHPDYIQIKPAGPIIRIRQIRELLQTLAMRPYEAKFRVVVISDAHYMNPEASNALLKALEEPPPHTVLILTASGTTDLLPTVVSRCQHIRFNPLSMGTLAAVLMKDHDIEKDRAYALAGLSDGGMDKALNLYKEGWLEKRNWILTKGGFFFDDLNRGQPVAKLFALANELSLKREVALTALFILKTLYRDILVCQYQPDQLINSDVKDFILKAADKSIESDVLHKITAIDNAQKNIRENANSRLTLEALFLTLAKKIEMN